MALPRSIPWNRVTKNVDRPTLKVGRPRLVGIEAATRRTAVMARMRELLTGRRQTFRTLMQACDYYESEIREALRALGVTRTSQDGIRSPVYTIPAPQRTAAAPSLN